LLKPPSGPIKIIISLFLWSLSFLISIKVFEALIFDDAKDVLNSLGKNTQILICSNLAKPYSQPLNNIDCLKVLSYEVGFIKPEEEIYSICLDKLKVDARNTLFIGDNFISDYLTPKKLGINACWLNRKK